MSGGQWYTGEAGLRDDFQGVAWYVAIALVAGLVLGMLTAWLFDRSELVTLVAVLVGSALAAYLMLRVGTHLSPPDPHELAKTAQDGDKLKGALRVTVVGTEGRVHVRRTRRAGPGLRRLDRPGARPRSAPRDAVRAATPGLSDIRFGPGTRG